MLFSIIPVLALAAVAAALPTEEQAADCPRIRCFDALSNCGVKYGGCYDICSQQQPPPPPCPVITSSPTITSSTTASPCTSTGTACVDYLRTCGDPPTAILTFGGCYPACGPTPTFSPPPCPTTDASAPPTITSSTGPTVVKGAI